MNRQDFYVESMQVINKSNAAWLGRRRARMLAALVVTHWPVGESWSGSRDDLHERLYAACRSDLSGKYGSIWMMILLAILSEVIKALIEHWWNSGELTRLEQ